MKLHDSAAWPALSIPYRAYRALWHLAPPLATAARWLVTSREDTNFTYPLTRQSER